MTVLAQAPQTWDWDTAREVSPLLLEGLWVTIRVMAVGITVALAGGLVLAVLRRSRFRVVRWPVGLFVEFVRGTPLLVQLFFLFFVLPEFDVVLSPFTAGVIGLGVHYACYTSETYRAGIESVPKGQWEAATAVNLSTAATWRSVVLPQAVPTVLPALGNYVVASLKDAPLVSTISVPGILYAANRFQGLTFRGLEAYTLTGLYFLAVSVPLAIGVRRLEKRYGYQRD